MTNYDNHVTNFRYHDNLLGRHFALITHQYKVCHRTKMVAILPSDNPITPLITLGCQFFMTTFSQNGCHAKMSDF